MTNPAQWPKALLTQADVDKLTAMYNAAKVRPTIQK
jgi:hypothetical protein